MGGNQQQDHQGPYPRNKYDSINKHFMDNTTGFFVVGFGFEKNIMNLICRITDLIISDSILLENIQTGQRLAGKKKINMY